MDKIIIGKSIEEIVNTYSDMLVRIAFNNVKSIADAEDVVQDVYIKLMSNKKDFVNEEHLKSWLIRVTINKCKDFFKSSWFKKIRPLKDALNIVSPDEESLMEELFKLSVEERNIIFLYYYESYTIKEIANILMKKENTISSKLQRSRRKLKVLIEEERSLS